MLTRADIQSVSPALDRYTQGSLLGEIWKRPEFVPSGSQHRDAADSLVSSAANAPPEPSLLR
jgi:hypothetical protein